jgi:hypothetical protein
MLLNYAPVRAFWSQGSQFASITEIASDSLDEMVLENQLSPKYLQVKLFPQVAQ